MGAGGEMIDGVEVRPGVVWIRPGARSYTVTDIVAGLSLLAVLELLVGYWIVSMTSSRVYGVAAMGVSLLVILLAAKFVLHRNIRRTRRRLRHARRLVVRAIEGDPDVDDAMLCGALFALRRASGVDVSSVRMSDIEKIERRLSRRLPRVWIVSDELLEVESGFVPDPLEHKDSLASRRAGLPMYRKGEQIWASSPVVPVADQASALSVLLWILGLLAVVTLTVMGAGARVLLLTIVGFILVSMLWLSRANPAGHALAVTAGSARIARRRGVSRLGAGRAVCPEDALVIIRPAPVGVAAPGRRGGPAPQVWRFVADEPGRSPARAIEVVRFDPELSPWWWVADQSWGDGVQGEPND